MWWVLGTLGSFLAASRSALRFLFSPPALPWLRAGAGTDWPAETSLESFPDFEGFEDEHRRWWPRRKGIDAAAAAAALGADEAAWGAVHTTRRTDEGSMVRDRQSPAAEGRIRRRGLVSRRGWRRLGGPAMRSLVVVTSKPGFGRNGRKTLLWIFLAWARAVSGLRQR